MTDNQRVRPVVAAGEIGAKARCPLDDGVFGLFVLRPPDLLDPAEIVAGPVAFQDRTRGADVAGERVTLADDGVDGDGQAERGGDRAGGLESARVRGDD